jgi:nucleoside-diphosphate-sugar epimerase
MAETVLVTGGTGYVAGWCIVELLNRGYDVRATVRGPARETALRRAVATAVAADDRLSCVVADLTADDGWDAAVAGCDYVLHVASPLGPDNPRDPQAMIVPARDGALRVLRAATRAGVRRVVMTSAANASSPSSYGTDGITDETLWTDPHDPTLTPYRASKTIAERAAWDFIEGSASATSLATILPGAVFGPVLDRDNPGTTQVIGRLLRGEMFGIPKIGLEIVDVRDVADAHIRAMTSPEGAGQRFLATGEFKWMSEVSRVLRSQLGDAARKVPTRELPNVAVRALALVVPDLRAIRPGLGRRNRHSTEKAQRVLGWRPRPATETVIDCARSLIEHGLAPSAAAQPSAGAAAHGDARR